MNYRHAYHAGNFADVLKHAVLALVIEHLKQKPAPFRVIDTHAGIGLYNLEGPEAGKTGEWKEGIGRLWGVEPAAEVREALAPYLGVVAGENPTGRLERYPGSPLVARRLLRRGDALVANEMHPEDHARLKQLFAGDPQAEVLALDGWTAVKSLLPPKERRAVVLIDPPFEEPGEFLRLTQAVAEAAHRFASGIVLAWYPIKDERAVARFRRAVAALGLPKVYSAELRIAAASSAGQLAGTGLIVLNPPFTLPASLERLMPYLAKLLSRDGDGECRLEWLAGEGVTSS